MRYGMADVTRPKNDGFLLMSVPQDAEQVPEELPDLLDMKGVTRILIEYDLGTGCKAVIYTKIEDKPDASTDVPPPPNVVSLAEG